MPRIDKPVYVIGAGYTGGRLIDALPNGFATGLSRSGPAIFDLDAGDTQPPDWPNAFDVVYTVPPVPEHSRLARFLDMLKTVPGRFVYLSTSGVYGDRDGELVDEQTPPAPATDRAKRRLADETELTHWAADHQVDAIILRVPGIYGPGRLGLERLRKRTPVIAEIDANPGNRIHVDDLVSCCIAALDPDTPAGIYNVGDGDHRSSTWFAREVARQAGLEEPPAISRIEAEREFGETRMSFLSESRRLDVTRMQTVLRPRLRYTDPVKGIAASL
ncbi:MAG: NAD-dependent epimerase/dehydratase family protein [Woeseiaceae bacterium]|nr:NAD-dependent epimerase/dehydratase family protein [Woeseiaceae bacterium]